MLIGLDMTVLHLAAPELGASLRPNSSELLWIVDIYGFMVAGFLITMGTLGDRIGRRRLLLVGATAFGLASLVAAYSVNVPMLIAARALLGIAGATLMPSTLSLISNMFRDAHQRRFAIAVWMTNFLIGGAVGPLVGGVLLAHFWWGSVFLIGVPLPVILIVAGRFLLPEYRDPGSGRIDPVSVFLSIATVIPVVYGLKELARNGFEYPSLVSIAAGAAFGVAFVLRQLRSTDPVLDVALFRRPAFSVALSAQTMGLFVQTGIQFLLLQYFQLVLGMSALRAGLLVLPAMVAGVIGSLAAPMLTRWLHPGAVMNAGFGLAAVGLLAITVIDGTSGLVLGAAGFAIAAFGISVALALTNDVIISSAPPERAGSAAGAGETGAELGNALGVAILGSVVTAAYRAEVTGQTMPDGVPDDLAGNARDTLAGATAVTDRLSEPVGAELLDLTRQAFTDGMRYATIATIAIVVALIIAIETLLRRQPEQVPDDVPETQHDSR
jgi:DHA2 family multidrug resistance protein-like MFS transporter